MVKFIPSANVFAHFLLGQLSLFSEKIGNLFGVVWQYLVVDQHLDPLFGAVVELSDASDEQVFLRVTSPLVFRNHTGVDRIVRLQRREILINCYYVKNVYY